MLCQFEKVIFPREAAANFSGFMIAIYKPCGVLRDAAGNQLDQFKAVGYCLPTSDKVRYRMEGRWSKTQKHGIQFAVERYEEVITPTREGIIAYLASGQIRGIGKKIAERIYETFGADTLQVLDKEPKKLLTVTEKGMGKRTDFSDFRLMKNRGGRGVQCQKISEKTGKLAAIITVAEDDDIMIITNEGTIIRTPVSSINVYSRTAGGVIIMRLAEGSYINNITRLEKDEKIEEESRAIDDEIKKEEANAPAPEKTVEKAELDSDEASF